MTAFLPTAADLDHWTRFLWAFAGVFVVLLVAWFVTETLQDSLDAMRQAETPEPVRRQQLNTVIQFPNRRTQ